MSTVKQWKIKEHYVAGEFAGYVVVTDDKYEDVVCRGIGVDYREDAVLIASAPELKAERDRLREALVKLKECLEGYFGKTEKDFFEDCNEDSEELYFADVYNAALTH
nr:MAG TPA: hypothetical protein [Caudoviricetes sp.]